MKGNYRTADGKAQIDWQLETQNGKQVFSAQGEYDGGMGQCLEAIAKDYPDDPMVQEIVEVWREWHLNDMRPGTPEQEAEIQRRSGGKGADYETACNWLKEAKLYEVVVTPEFKKTALGGFPGMVYKYGERWLFRAIPKDVISKIESWGKLPARKPLHESQAEDWLKQNGITMRITLSDTKPANWTPAGHHYRVTLSRSGHLPKGFPPRLVFDFWGSANDAEKNKNPTPYDVLTCVSSDVNAPETFEDYCAEFGSDPNSIKDKQTFRRLQKFSDHLREFLTTEEIETLRSIR